MGNYNRITAFGLTCTCPFGVFAPDCPFKDMRKLPAEDCDKLISEMPKEELLKLISHHQECSNNPNQKRNED